MDRYDVTGMSCAACQSRVEKAVNEVDGVTSCSVNLLMNSMQVEGNASPEKIIKAVKDAGYGASLQGGAKASSVQDDLSDKTTGPILRRFVISLGFLLVLMYLSMGHMMFGFPVPSFLEGNHTGLALLQMILAACVMVINRNFFVSGAKAVLHKSANMDTLVALGSAASFIYSTVILFLMTVRPEQSGELMKESYFESAAMIPSLVTLGKALESYSKGRTKDAIRGLMKLRPDTAVVIRDGAEITIPADSMEIGDIFIVRSGESIPADGIIIEGNAAMDESAVTGESIPVDKTSGDSVISATINSAGYIKCKATNVGNDTLFSKIIRTVNDAAATKAPVARLADKVSAVFVPAVLIIAAVTVVIWLLTGRDVGFSLARGITVLVVSCPCALGLATPVAIMVGSGVGAKNGILFKNATALQTLGQADIVCLDKTGTVTEGQPEVMDVIAYGISGDELIRIASGIEKLSEHPLAQAVVRKAEQEGAEPLPASRAEVLPGNGISAYIGDEKVIAGSVTFTDPPEDIRAVCDELASSGKTPMVFMREGTCIGVIAVSDKIRQDAKASVSQLKGMGIKTVMITGDNSRTADAVASQVGIDEVTARVLPSQKKETVEKYKRGGMTVMVGDGINDAPALAGADLGIAIGGGTDVAADAADVVLMKKNMSDVPSAIRLSRGTYRIIKQNLFWALIYNVLLIPVAAGAYINLFGITMEPMYGAAAMSISSFFVVTNALRLNLIDIYDGSRDRMKKGAKRQASSEDTERITMEIEGMMCPHCEESVKKALEGIGGSDVTADHVSGTALATFSGGADCKKIAKAVKAAGYKLRKIRRDKAVT